MQRQPYEIKTKIQILKPVRDVFEAIVDPAKMSNYFIAHGTGRMEEGKTLTWRFPEFDEESPVRVGGITTDKYVSFYWTIGKQEMLVEIELTPAGDNATVVTIREKAVEGNGDIDWLKGNTEGWANLLACLKAYLEYSINLRKGAFDFMKTPQPQS
ncbi:MAG TPA: SRPBCC domain-containing protein [Chitinophagales bacterium]|nr:SRPBCC domain-containing protein [Chitinophagales bacterium]